MASAVLVHGGCAGPWEWDRVRPFLEAEGLDVYVPALPSVGEAAPLGDMHADALAVRELLDGLTSPVILCGHSYGGVVITEASVGPHPSVAHLVYLAAFMPAEGETFMSLKDAHPGGLTEDDSVLFGDDGTYAFNPETQVKAKVSRGWSPEEARHVAELHRRQSMLVAAQAPSSNAWESLPTTFVRCVRDELIPSSLADVFAGRAKEVIEMDTDHDPEWTKPDEVASILIEAARRYR